MGLSLKLEVPSDPRILCVVRSAVERFASLAGFGEEDCRSITLALDETMTNIIRHAYGGRHDQAIELHCRGNEERIEFVLLDHGQSVPPEKIRGRPLEDVRPGGLGTHIIAQIMDQVSYEPLPVGNQWKLVKHLPGKRQT
jgi:anti-sigma regulatory factor (Ser/Thr protein kinase)